MKLHFILIISCIYLLEGVNSKSKYYDGPDRAYKFGYSIEGNQHRSESKDENGIIMGEFGFITGDGVYHVTGYGTDENGNFKILYMRNIKIGLPGEPGQKEAPKNLGGQQAPPQTTTVAPRPAVVAQQPSARQGKQLGVPKLPKASDIVACSSCTIPEIEKEVNEVLQQEQAVPQFQNPASVGGQNPALPGVVGKPGSAAAAGSSAGSPSSSASGFGGAGSSSGSGSRLGGASGTGASSASGSRLGGATVGATGGATSGASSEATSGAQQASGNSDAGNQNLVQGRTGKALGLGFGDDGSNVDSIDDALPIDVRGGSARQLGDSLGAGPGSALGRASVSAGEPSPGALTTVTPSSGRSSSSGSPNVGSSFLPLANGSPAGSRGDTAPPSKIPLDLSKMQNIINGILYKFNYTVGYHGHHEQGDTVGNKDGGYFSVGRDGFHRSVEYTANENGFQPHIKLRPADDVEIPKPETEKEAGLKGYEFKWFNLGDDKKQ